MSEVVPDIPTSRTVVAFDLDGTLTRGDTLLPFLRRARGRTRTTGAVLVRSLDITRALVFACHRQRAKEALLGRLLTGQEVTALQETATLFAEEVVEHRLRPAALERAQAHRRAGHELVIVSASPALYVEPIGRLLGFDAVLATRLEAGPDGRLTGRIEELNCRGPEKVARLEEWAVGGPVVLYAYGDSSGDRELLAGADAAFRLPKGGLLRRRSAPRRGSDVVVDDPRVGVDR